MNNNEKIWAIAKWRFLQSEASSWTIGNKALEVIFIAGLVVWIYSEFISDGNNAYIKYFGLVAVFVTFTMMRVRYCTYCGFFDGYESGFKDAATKNLDYWGDRQGEHSDEAAVYLVLQDIDKNEKNICESNLASRNAKIQEGYSNLLGYFLTWRKLR